METIDIPDISGAYYVLVVGETGSGKSTFINTVINRYRGGNLSNPPASIKVAIPTPHLPSTEPEARNSSEANVGDQTKSQTSLAVPYVNVMDGQGTVVLIDTPGLSDTAGVAQDDKNIGIILDAANRCPSLSAIILVANGSIGRFGVNVRTTLSRLNGNIPDIALRNIVYVLTNVAGSADANFVVAKAPFAPKYVCYMNNSAFSRAPKDWNARSKLLCGLDWDASMYVVGQLFEGVSEMGKVSTGQFAQMREQRDLVKQALHEGRLKVEELQKIQNDILDIEAQMRRSKEDQNRFKDFTSQKVVKRVVMEPTPYHNTLCSTCNTVCHQNCGLDEVQVAGDSRFLGCCAFSGAQHCGVCGGETRCGHGSHYHARSIPRVTEETLDEVLQDIKDDYDKATAGVAAAETNLSKLSDAKALVENSISNYSQDILRSCNDIKSICKGFNFAEEMHILVQQLEAHRQMLTDPVARKTSQSFIDSINGIIQGLHNDQVATLAPVITAGSYTVIECTDVAPSLDMPPAPPVMKKTPSTVSSGGTRTTTASRQTGTWCKRCSAYHDNIFSCGKLAELEAKPAATVGAQKSVAPVASIVATTATTTSVGNPNFPRLSVKVGNDKFSRVYSAKLQSAFGDEATLLEYAAAYVDSNDVTGLKTQLVADAGLGSIDAQMLAGHLCQLK